MGAIVGAVVTIATGGNVALGAAAGMFVGSVIQGAVNNGIKGALWGAFTATGLILGGALGAGITGGIAAEAQGGSFGQGFAGGFVSGIVVGATMLAQSQGIGFNFGNTPVGVFAKEIANDFTRGFVVGTVGSLASGRKFSDPAEDGLLAGGFSAGSTQFGNLIGHAYGFIASGGKGPEFRDGAFFYEPKTYARQAVTLGNAITGSRDFLNETVPGTTYTVREHELAHVPMARGLGMFHVPVNALALGLSYVLTGGESFHAANPFENPPLQSKPCGC